MFKYETAETKAEAIYKTMATIWNLLNKRAAITMAIQTTDDPCIKGIKTNNGIVL